MDSITTTLIGGTAGLMAIWYLGGYCTKVPEKAPLAPDWINFSAAPIQTLLRISKPREQSLAEDLFAKVKAPKKELSILTPADVLQGRVEEAHGKSYEPAYSGVDISMTRLLLAYKLWEEFKDSYPAIDYWGHEVWSASNIIEKLQSIAQADESLPPKGAEDS